MPSQVSKETEGKSSINASRANLKFFFSFFSLKLRRLRLTVATTFRLSVFFLSFVYLLFTMHYEELFPFFISSSAPFFHVLFFLLLRFIVNKSTQCEYYIIRQTYSIIKFVHAEFHFVAFVVLLMFFLLFLSLFSLSQ